MAELSGAPLFKRRCGALRSVAWGDLWGWEGEGFGAVGAAGVQGEEGGVVALFELQRSFLLWFAGW